MSGPKNYRVYFRTHLPGRKLWANWQQTARVQLLRVAPAPQRAVTELSDSLFRQGSRPNNPRRFRYQTERNSKWSFRLQNLVVP